MSDLVKRPTTDSLREDKEKALYINTVRELMKTLYLQSGRILPPNFEEMVKSWVENFQGVDIPHKEISRLFKKLKGLNNNVGSYFNSNDIIAVWNAEKPQRFYTDKECSQCKGKKYFVMSNFPHGDGFRSCSSCGGDGKFIDWEAKFPDPVERKTKKLALWKYLGGRLMFIDGKVRKYPDLGEDD